MIRLSAAILIVLLAACGELIDADEARLCRMTLPAINDAARLDIQQTRPGPFPFSLRIDYRAIGADGAMQARFVICRFSAERGARSKRDLIGLATEFGPIADASFFFLKRFFLDAPATGAADRAPPSASTSLPEVPSWLA
jgi:branched-chain amino acid transport system permease protein